MAPRSMEIATRSPMIAPAAIMIRLMSQEIVHSAIFRPASAPGNSTCSGIFRKPGYQEKALFRANPEREPRSAEIPRLLAFLEASFPSA